MSRPEKPIDWKLVDELLEAGCMGTEIAAHFSMHPNTFYDRVAAEYGVSFTEYSSEKNQKGEAMLKAAQYAKALGKSKKGDTTLLTFLGKVRLKQKENHEITLAPNDAAMNFADAYIKSEASNLEMQQKIELLKEELNAIKPKADPIV